jgi:hypothetical protein
LTERPYSVRGKKAPSRHRSEAQETTPNTRHPQKREPGSQGTRAPVGIEANCWINPPVTGIGNDDLEARGSRKYAAPSSNRALPAAEEIY